MKFTAKWEGKRTPTVVEFPDGTKRTVNYMRDGLILFKDNFSCGYERKGEFEAEINIPESHDEVKEIIFDNGFMWSIVSFFFLPQMAHRPPCFFITSFHSLSVSSPFAPKRLALVFCPVARLLIYLGFPCLAMLTSFITAVAELWNIFATSRTSTSCPSSTNFWM